MTVGISHSYLGNYVAKVSTPILQMKRLRHNIITRKIQNNRLLDYALGFSKIP